MRHLKKGKKFHKQSAERRSFLRNLTNNLIKRGVMQTTVSRAKAVRPIAERLVTLAKKQDLAHRRLIQSRVIDKNVTKKLFDEISPRYEKRSGGYLKIVRLGKFRKRDGAELVKIEFV